MPAGAPARIARVRDDPRMTTSEPEAPATTAPRLRSVEAAALTFLAAGAILVLEVAAARLVAPWIGVSLTTYTSIIGVILAGIALGAWLGGRAADAAGPERLLGITFVLGGAAAVAAVPIVAIAGPALASGGTAGGFLLSTAAFVAPAAVLAAIAPMIVRATIRDVATSGSLVGRLSAIGTAGALTGTFLTGYVLLGLVPVRAIIVGTGALLVLVGLLVMFRLRVRPTAGALSLVVAAGGFAALAVAAGSPCERESAYYCIAVRDDETRPGGRTLVLDNLRHAHVNLDDPTALEFAYIRWYAAAVDDLVAATPGLQALHLGAGGVTFPRYLLARDPASRHLVLELDPVVLATTREELGLTPDERIQVVLGDARRTIEDVETDSRDLVVGDAFGGKSVPWHLTTREYVEEIDRVLRPGGRYVMNVIDGEQLAFARAEAETLRSVFEHVAIATWTAAFDGESGGNVVLVASHDPIPWEAIRDEVERVTSGATVIGGHDVDAFTAGSPILTDDFAPADQLIER